MPSRDAGRYDREITFQTLTETQSDTGYSAESWANIATNPTVWAKVSHKDGREYYQADKVNAEVVKLFRVRYRSDLTNKMRIVYEGCNYDILTLDADSRTGEVFITAKTEGRDGS